jgi:hypothetical protein
MSMFVGAGWRCCLANGLVAVDVLGHRGSFKIRLIEGNLDKRGLLYQTYLGVQSAFGPCPRVAVGTGPRKTEMKRERESKGACYCLEALSRLLPGSESC